MGIKHRAKVKGNDLLDYTQIMYWTYLVDIEKFTIGGPIHSEKFKTQMTMSEWHEVGINKSNADFEEVNS